MRRYGVVAVLLPLLLAMPGCSDDDDDDDDVAISGRVVDAQGQPVAGASVVLAFNSTSVMAFSAAENPYPLIVEPTPENQILPADVGDSTCVEVYDGCGEYVARYTCIGDEVCPWDERDDDGLRVPPGLYTLRPQDCESLDPLEGSSHYVESTGIESLLNDGTLPLVVTDSEGRFSIPRCVIPFGAQFYCTIGDPMALCKLTNDATVYAWKGTDNGGAAVVLKSSGTVDVNVQFDD